MNQKNINNSTTNSGVYVLYIHYTDDKWRPVYVGISDNIRKRLQEHLACNNGNPCVTGHITRKHRMSFLYGVVPITSTRQGAEKYLYDLWHPECNSQDPGGSPVPVNTPNV